MSNEQAIIDYNHAIENLANLNFKGGIPEARENKLTQSDRILHLLSRYPNQWVPLTEILDLRIAQYGRAINDLRKLEGVGGKRIYDILNKTEWIDGVKHSWFKLVRE